jgi:hypothetical protein
MTRRMPRCLLLGTLLALCAGCATGAGTRCAVGMEARMQDTLYFGRAMPDGVVTDAQWVDFLRDAVTPRFPAGLSVWPAAGQWRGNDGRLVREDAQVLTLLHEGDGSQLAAIDAIIVEYKSRFRQEAVLRVKQAVCVAF